MKHIKTAILIISSVLHPSIQANAQPPEVVFNITPDDAAYISYLEFQNKFNYSAVDYMFGEVRILSSSANFRVNLRPWNSSAATIQGAGVQGENSDLLEFARTETFTMPEDEPVIVEFFRKVGKWAPSLAYPEQPDDPPGTPGRTPWDVLDQSEWLVELRLASTGETVLELDKVGVLPYDKFYTDAYYGTDPLYVRQSKEISNGHPGENVYIQIVPKRWGPTPFGMSLMLRQGGNINYSALSDEFGNFLSSSATIALSDQWFQAVLDYCETVKLNTGSLPAQQKWRFSRAQFQTFQSTFFQQTILDGHEVLIEQNPPPTPRLLSKELIEEASIAHVPALYLKEVTPNPVSAETVKLVIGGHMDVATEISLTTTDGREVGVLWKGRIGKGGRSLSLSLPKLASGVYVIAVMSDNVDLPPNLDIKLRRDIFPN